MFYTNPGFIYILIAIMLFSVYYGIEKSHGNISNSAKSMLCMWSISSFLIVSIILGIKKQNDMYPETVNTSYILLMYSLCIGTLLSSSFIINYAS